MAEKKEEQINKNKECDENFYKIREAESNILNKVKKEIKEMIKEKKTNMKTYGTSARCPKCGEQLYTSDIGEYSFVYKECGENFHTMEVTNCMSDFWEINIPMLPGTFKEKLYCLKEIFDKYNCDFLGYDPTAKLLDIGWKSGFPESNIFNQFVKEIKETMNNDFRNGENFIMECNESINEIISTLRQHGYEYTQYSHKNGKSTINTNILLEVLEKQISEEGMHLVKIFTFAAGYNIEKLINTNASDDVINNICGQIEEDGLLNGIDKFDGILKVLNARGYKTIVIDTPKFRI